jgi:small-conductance mechanosensitive channel
MSVRNLLLSTALVVSLLCAALASRAVGAAQGTQPGDPALVPQQAEASEAVEGPGESLRFSDVWTYEILSIEGSPVTVGNIVVGLALLLIGFFASRLLSSLVRRSISPRMRLTQGGAAAIETLLFYLFLMIFAVSGLKVAGVPLTAFTLLGGAAAIGVGFGSQNVINNFISGLIILAERPVNVGNLIQIGDLYGVVERVGPRSTRVRTGDNVEIIVPNSTFLEQNVINWTLTESRVRVHVGVGVAYGSPVDEVLAVLRRVVDEHERAFKDPEPIVLFADFGSSSLDFEVHFWIEMQRMMDRRRVESEIRQAIDRRFREAGIVIAFPQRDVHLDAARPLEVVVRDRVP